MQLLAAMQLLGPGPGPGPGPAADQRSRIQHPQHQLNEFVSVHPLGNHMRSYEIQVAMI